MRSLRQLLAVAGKELLLLRRDRTGLLVLFVMPLILVVILTLVQENVMELSGRKKTRVLLLDLDRGELGPALLVQLQRGNLELVPQDALDGSAAALRQLVRQGGFLAGIIIPPRASVMVAEAADQLAARLRGGDTTPAPASLQLVFDPGIMPGLRSGITAQVRMAVQTVALHKQLAGLEQLLQVAGGAGPRPGLSSPPPDLAALLAEPLIRLEEERHPAGKARLEEYNPVQQNTPAWALFGMFFTAIAIGGSILRERQSGIWPRLATLPVSPLLLFGGKVLAYLLICCCQFTLIGLIGALLFPRLGLPAFTIAPHPAGVLLVVLCAGLAACSYGILLGIACTTYEQTSTVGATSVVAASAIGGVMVPTHAMPEVMRQLSVISPLNWGLSASNDLLLRGLPLDAVMDDLARLLTFAAACVLIAWRLTRTRL